MKAEDDALALLYRNHVEFAVGHGPAPRSIAQLLKIDRKPLPSWNEDQWARFRDEVREALKP